MNNANKASPSQLSIFSWQIILSLCVAGLLLLVANSAYWFERAIFTPSNFATIATNAITSESSRNAMATDVVDQLIKNKPVLKDAIDDSLSKLLSGFLDSARMENVFETTITKLQTAITSPDPEPVAFDLTGVKNMASRLLPVVSQITGREFEQVNATDLPDSLVLFDLSKLPNIYNAGVAILWIGPLAFIVALILLAWPLFRFRRDRSIITQLCVLEAVLVALTAIVGYLLGPLFKPMFLSSVPDQARVVASNIYDAFITTFNNQTDQLWLLVIGFLIAALVFYLKLRSQKAST